MLRAFKFSLDEAVLSLWRGRRSGALSVATITVALFVLGGFLLTTTNLQRLGEEWSKVSEMSVYLNDQVTAAERASLEQILAPGDVVASYEFVSKPEALKRFKQIFADLANAVESLDGNPLPASYEVRLRPSAGSQAAIEALSMRLQGTSGVADVRYDREWLDRLLSAVSVVRTLGLVLGGLLTLAAALSVANVVRLALYARRDEIEIMHLVGAPHIYIRGPFVMEGVLQGGLGALLALATLAVLFLTIRSRYLVPLAATLNLSGVRFLPLELCALLLLGGMVVGCIGGAVAATAKT